MTPEMIMFGLALYGGVRSLDDFFGWLKTYLAARATGGEAMSAVPLAIRPEGCPDCHDVDSCRSSSRPARPDRTVELTQPVSSIEAK